MSNGNGKKIIIGVVSAVTVVAAIVGAVLWRKSAKNGNTEKDN